MLLPEDPLWKRLIGEYTGDIRPVDKIRMGQEVIYAKLQDISKTQLLILQKLEDNDGLE